MLLYSGADPNDPKAPPIPGSCVHNLTYLQSLQVIRQNNQTKSIKLKLYTEDGMKLKLK